MNTWIPCLSEKRAFVRKEKEDKLLFIPDGLTFNEALIFNNVGRYILEAIDGTQTVADINRLIVNMFPDIPPLIIISDIKTFLQDVTRLNVIKWKEGGFKVYDGKKIDRLNDSIVWRCGEGYIRRILKLLEDPSIELKYINPDDGEEMYDSLSIRAKQFSYLEEFYILIEQEQPTAMISFVPSKDIKSKVTRIGSIIIKNADDSKLLTFFLNKAILDIKNECYSYDTKVRIKLIQNHSDTRPMYNILQQILCDIGFKEICVLENEYGMGQHALLLDRIMA